MSFFRTADLRYIGQFHEVEVEMPMDPGQDPAATAGEDLQSECVPGRRRNENASTQSRRPSRTSTPSTSTCTPSTCPGRAWNC